ncbi:hypothetical protein ElyMa_005665900 [Elysia marginata]|uniref:Uncharacterized protein n=1 Tax=Elysia marginata TaxID=1093978 RepID=A0AAV4FDW7_9GAST|nr:hypothetical protein ElyMa_005665900 [Elysia marginata]
MNNFEKKISLRATHGLKTSARHYQIPELGDTGDPANCPRLPCLVPCRPSADDEDKYSNLTGNGLKKWSLNARAPRLHCTHHNI